MKSIADVTDLKGKRVLVRTDFNTTAGSDGLFAENETFRIHKAMRTLDFLRQQGARIIIISHVGRDLQETLEPIATYMQNEMNINSKFVSEITGDSVRQKVDNLQDGEILILENLRSHAGEKTNSADFAQELASYADLYVNEAFSNSHREHTSMVGVPKLLPSYAGFQFIDEVNNLDKVRSPEQPLLVIMGGVKFETKLDLMHQFLPTAQHIVVGGGLANRLYQDKGLNIGGSLVDDEGDTSDLVSNEKILLPKNVITEQETKSVKDIRDSERILDVEVAEFQDLIQGAKTILWNGPMGYYEGGFTKGTVDIAKMIAESDATSIVGGGDTVNVLYDENILDKFTFVSTAGGAMLDYLVHGTLPGIEVLK